MTKSKQQSGKLLVLVKSRFFLLGLAILVSGAVIIGIQSFAASLPTYNTSLSTCTSKTLYKGGTSNTADCVKYAQDRLNYACKTSYWPWTYSVDLKVDGAFGDATRDKTLGFQKATGLYQDGVIGSGTWSKLNYYPRNNLKDKLLCRQ